MRFFQNQFPERHIEPEEEITLWPPVSLGTYRHFLTAGNIFYAGIVVTALNSFVAEFQCCDELIIQLAGVNVVLFIFPLKECPVIFECGHILGKGPIRIF